MHWQRRIKVKLKTCLDTHGVREAKKCWTLNLEKMCVLESTFADTNMSLFLLSVPFDPHYGLMGSPWKSKQLHPFRNPFSAVSVPPNLHLPISSCTFALRHGVSRT